MNFRTRRRWRILFAGLILYALAGFFLLPAVLEREIAERLSEKLERHVTIGRVRTNPFALSLTLEHLEVAAPDGNGALLGWDSFYVNFDALGSILGEWTCSDVALKGFHAAVEVRPDGSSNFSYLIEKFAPDSPADNAPDKSRPWRFRRVDVADGRVEVIDRSRAESFATVVGPINFTLLDFHTAGDRGAPYQFVARTESGEMVDWSGTLRASPLASTGEWRIENLRLPKYAPYFQDRLPVILTGGKLTADGKYEVDFAPAHRRLALKDARLHLEKLQLIDRTAGQPVLDLAELEVSDIAADALAAKLTVGAVHLNGGRVNAKRERDGTLNLLPMMPPPATTTNVANAGRATAVKSKMAAAAPATAPAANAAPNAAPKPEPSVNVGEMALRDFTVNWADETTTRPVAVALTRVNGAIKDFTVAKGAAIPVSVTLACQPQGTFNAVGQVTLDPLRAELDLEAAWLPLAVASPYAETMIAGRVMRGTASLKGRAVLARNDAGNFSADFTGDARVENVALAGASDEEELAGVGELAASELKLVTAPKLAVTAAEVKVVAPFAHVVVAQDKSIGLLGLVRHDGAAAEVGVKLPSQAPEPAGPEITINRVVIGAGEFDFTDHSIEPAVHYALNEVSGGWRDVSSLRPERGELELKAKVNGAAPVTIRGRANAFMAAPVAEMKASADAVDLAPAGPYVGKFAGFALEHGTLFLDADVRVAERRLDLRNKVTLDQFTLGAATNSPDAVKLPVRLGVALLKDAQGKIVLDLPVQGRLDDPQFSVGPVVGKVVGNLLAKAATSPFALLGSMFGGGGEELGLQEFVAGETNPTAESARRLTTIVRAMKERPALRLEIEGGYDPAADGVAVAQMKFEERVRERVAEARRGQGAEAVAVGQRSISEQEREVAVGQLYAEKFPGGGEQAVAMAASETPRAEVKPEPKAPEKKPGFIRKTINVVTFKGLRERRAARKERERAEEAMAAEQRPGASPLGEGSQEPADAASVAMSVEEMTQRLTQTMAATPEELKALAEARARHVREQLLAAGIAAERVSEKKDDRPAAEKLGTKVKLNLR